MSVPNGITRKAQAYFADFYGVPPEEVSVALDASGVMHVEVVHVPKGYARCVECTANFARDGGRG